MTLSTIQLVVFIAIGLIVLAGVVFVLQDVKAQRREQEELESRRQRMRAHRAQREHETA